MLRRGMRDACKYRTAYRKPIRRGMSRFPRFDVRVSSEASALRNEGGPAMPMPNAHARSFMGRDSGGNRKLSVDRPRPLSFIFLSFGRTRPYDDLMRAQASGVNGRTTNRPTQTSARHSIHALPRLFLPFLSCKPA